MKTRYIHLLAFAAAAYIASPAAADIIYLKNGQRQSGLITLDRADLPTISIRTSAGEIAVRRDRIDRVEVEPKALSYMRLGDQYLEQRLYREAVSAYEAGLAADKNNAEIPPKLKEAQAGVAQLEKAAVEQAQAEINTSIERAVQLSQEKKFQEAAELLRSVEPTADSPKAEPFRRAATRIYLDWGIDRMDRQDMSGAAEKLQLALRYDPNNTEAKQRLAVVWENDPTKQEAVAEFYKAGDSPGDQIKLADIYFRNRNYEGALPIYLKYVHDPQLGTQTMETRIRESYDALHRRYADEGNYQKASETYQALLAFSPNEDIRPLARYEFMLRRAKTDLNDPNERAALAKWAEDHGLPETARTEYMNVLQMAPSNKAATEGLRRFAEADLRDATDFLAEQQFMLASNKANEMARTYPMFQDLVQQAQTIINQVAQQQQAMAVDRRQQGQQLALRGDDYYNQALAYLSSAVSTNVDPNTRIFSPRLEATRNLQRALYAWQTALSIDPSLGAPTSFDLSRKIQDAYAKYMVLVYPYAPPPIARNTRQIRD